MAHVFDCGGVDNLTIFKGTAHYRNYINALFRVDAGEKYANDRTPDDYYWNVADDEFGHFPSEAEGRRLLSRTPSLTLHYRNTCGFCYEDISPDQGGILYEDSSSIRRRWMEECLPDLESEGFSPVLFVLHIDGKRPRFYVVCSLPRDYLERFEKPPL